MEFQNWTRKKFFLSNYFFWIIFQILFHYFYFKIFKYFILRLLKVFFQIFLSFVRKYFLAQPWKLKKTYSWTVSIHLFSSSKSALSHGGRISHSGKSGSGIGPGMTTGGTISASGSTGWSATGWPTTGALTIKKKLKKS